MFGFCISSVMLQNLLVLLQASSTPVPLSQEIHTLAKVSQVTGLCGGYLLKHVHQLLADLSGKGKSHTMAMRETTNVAHQSHSITVFSFSFLSTSRTFFPSSAAPRTTSLAYCIPRRSGPFPTVSAPS